MPTLTIEPKVTTPSPTDDELMARIESGDVESSLGTLRRRHGRSVHQLAKTIVRDEHVADDVTQEVFAKVFFKGHQYQRGTNFRAWLLGVARNQALTVVRQERHIPRAVGSLNTSTDIDDLGGAALLDAGYEDRTVEEREFMAAFEAAVEGLPDRYRTVFRECVMKGRPYADLADEIGAPAGTVAIRIMRARQRLYRQLERNFDRIRRLPACLQ